MPRRWGSYAESSKACHLEKLHLLESCPMSVDETGEQRSSGSSGAIGKRRHHDTIASYSKGRPVMFLEKGTRHNVTLFLDAQLPVFEFSEKAAEYQMCLRVLFLSRTGWSKEKISERLGRAHGWVTKCLQISAENLPRPRDIPPYIAEYELRMLQLGVEPFRPPELRRGYVTDSAGLYQECVKHMPWRQAVFRKRNYETGEVTVTNIASNRQDCSYRGLKTGIEQLDEALDRVKRDFNIKDPDAYLLNNWYPDGNTSIAPHNHDFWSAILSFGEPRTFLLDGQPLLLGSGDLLVFGTQRHSVPKMPEVKEGRVSVAIFWYPERAAPPADVCTGCGLVAELLQEGEDEKMYCESCWHAWQSSTHSMPMSVNGIDDQLVTEEDMMAVALELSLAEQ